MYVDIYVVEYVDFICIPFLSFAVSVTLWYMIAHPNNSLWLHIGVKIEPKWSIGSCSKERNGQCPYPIWWNVALPLLLCLCTNKSKVHTKNGQWLATQFANPGFRKRQSRVGGRGGVAVRLCSSPTVLTGKKTYTHYSTKYAPSLQQWVRSQAINVWLIFISFRSQCDERGKKWAIMKRIYLEVALLCHMWSNGSWQEALRSYFLPVKPPLHLGWDNGPCPRFLLDPSVFITTLWFCTHSMLFAIKASSDMAWCYSERQWQWFVDFEM